MIECAGPISAQVCVNINSVAIAAVAAVCKAVGVAEVPWWVHEKGCTIAVPASYRNAVTAVLRATSQMATKLFGLNVRSVVVPISELQSGGTRLELCRYSPEDGVSRALLRSHKLPAFELLAEQPDYLVSESGDTTSDFSGFVDRWIPVQSNHGLVVSVIVRSLHSEIPMQSEVYKRVLAEVTSLTQATQEGCPLSIRGIETHQWKSEFGAEASIRSFSDPMRSFRDVQKSIQRDVRPRKIWRARSNRKSITKGASFVGTRSDFLSFSEDLRMHLDLRRGQVQRLRQILQVAEDHGHLVYGIHSSDHCLVRAVTDCAGELSYVIHGGAGGFQLAARRLNTRLRDLKLDD